jgi:NAD(P)H-dependent FMN reductase
VGALGRGASLRAGRRRVGARGGGPAAGLARSDAVVFCTPECACTLPGSLKNAIDWLVGTGELYRNPVAWINIAAPGRGAGAEATLSTVLGYVDADVVEPGLCPAPGRPCPGRR